EVVEDGAGRHVGGGGDVLDGDRRWSVGQGELDGGRADGVPRLGLLAFAQPRQPCHPVTMPGSCTSCNFAAKENIRRGCDLRIHPIGVTAGPAEASNVEARRAVPACRRAPSRPEETPMSEKQWKGRVAVDIRDAEPDWEPFVQPKAPEGAPNVLMILWDDVG